MKNKILQTIRQHHLLEKGMHVVVGLSGGPDSMCMFDVLCSMAEEWDLKIYPVHVNHKFRPGAAEEDQEFVERLCAAKGWHCRSFVYDCNAIAASEGLTSEEAGRKVRYEAFESVADEIAAGNGAEVNQLVPREHIAIAVGQNADDQAETVLFRLLRGTGVDGLAGIAYKRWDKAGNSVIRPLLDCSRYEIECYCKNHNLAPRYDHTNEEPIYMRNRIRLQLLPMLKEQYNPNMAAGLVRLAASAAMDSEYLWMETENAYEKAVIAETGDLVTFSLKTLSDFHPAIRIRIYDKALELIGGAENLAAVHLEGIEQVRKSLRPSASWDLPGGCIAEKQYDLLCLRKLSNHAEKGMLAVRKCASPIDNESAVCTNNVCVRLDLGKLQEAYGNRVADQIVMRTRMDGDFMRIRTGDGLLHRKKLQDIFVDMKIPKSLRSEIRLAAIGQEILWILPGQQQMGKKGRITSAYKAEDNSTRPIIILEYSVHV